MFHDDPLVHFASESVVSTFTVVLLETVSAAGFFITGLFLVKNQPLWRTITLAYFAGMNLPIAFERSNDVRC